MAIMHLATTAFIVVFRLGSIWFGILLLGVALHDLWYCTPFSGDLALRYLLHVTLFAAFWILSYVVEAMDEEPKTHSKEKTP